MATARSRPADRWFDVDHQGLAKLIERRGKAAILRELIANAWDADGVTRVDVSLAPVTRSPHVLITVTDDAPDGFSDLRHAWTLFAESARKRRADKRGRFNLGEKLVIALCDQASIVTTTGAVRFDDQGRHALRERRERGSSFEGLARVTRDELVEIRAELRRILPPDGVDVWIDGLLVPRRCPVAQFDATLPTEIAGEEDGVLRRTERACVVRAYEPLSGEVASIYQLGLPIVETGDRWHLDVLQKVPLNMEGDNVTPAYLRAIRAACANRLRDLLEEDDAAGALAGDALASADAEPQTVRRLIDLRFGEQRAIWDPSDPEANMRLVSKGYAMIRGGELTRPQWENVKKHGAAEPSGRIDPTKKVTFSPDGEDLWIPRERWTPAMRRVTEYLWEAGRALLGREITIGILSGVHLGWLACWGDDRLTFNVGRTGHSLFDECLERSGGPGPTARLNALFLHELGHARESNHLSREYHDALCQLGADLAQLALDRPKLFQWSTLEDEEDLSEEGSR